MAITDRRGVSVDATDTPIAGSPNPGLAIKAPCRVATTTNITLAGLQTIDGIALAVGNRVLVKNQTTQTQNGIYNASSGNWTRAIDAASNDQWANGTVVYVALGTSNSDKTFIQTSPDPVIVGTSNLAFMFLASSGVAANRAVNTTAPLAGGGVLSADLTLTLTYGATLTVAGGALETAAGTGDVTWAQNSFATTIGANAVSYAKFQAIEGLSLVGNAGSANDNVHSISGIHDQIPIVNHSGGALAFTTISGDITNVTGVFTIGTNVVDNARAAQMAAKTIKGNNTGGIANAADLTVPQVQALLAGPYIILTATGINFNSANSDTALAFTLPTGFTRFKLLNVTLTHASHDISTATFDLRTAPAGGGASFLSSTTVTLTQAAENTNLNAQGFVIANQASTSWLPSGFGTPNTIYGRVGTAEGAAATADLTVILQIAP